MARNLLMLKITKHTSATFLLSVSRWFNLISTMKSLSSRMSTSLRGLWSHIASRARLILSCLAATFMNSLGCSTTLNCSHSISWTYWPILSFLYTPCTALIFQMVWKSRVMISRLRRQRPSPCLRASSIRLIAVLKCLTITTIWSLQTKRIAQCTSHLIEAPKKSIKMMMMCMISWKALQIPSQPICNVGQESTEQAFSA